MFLIRHFEFEYASTKGTSALEHFCGENSIPLPQ